MALELNINAGDAAKKVDDVTQSLNELAAALGKVDVSGADKLAAASASVKPVDPAVAQSMNDVGDAAKKLDEAAAAADKLSSSLQNIKPADANVGESVSKVADGVQKAAAAAPQLSGVSEQLAKVGTSASGTESQMAGLGSRFSEAVGGLSGLGSGLSNVATEFGHMGGAAGTVGSAFSGMMEAGGGLPGLLVGIGVAIASIDWKKMADEANHAVQEITQLQRAVNAFSKDSQAAPAALEMLEKTAEKTGQGLENLERHYAKFFSIAAQSGQSTTKINKEFESMAIAMQAVGAPVEKMGYLFNTMDRWMSTGTMTAGMLGRSLSQVNMTLDMLGDGFKGLARNTQLPISAMDKLMEAFSKMKPQLLTMVENARVLEDQWHQMSVAFGLGIQTTAVKAFEDLNHIMIAFGPQLRLVANLAGQVYGVLSSLASLVEGVVVTAFGVFIQTLKGVWDVLDTLTFGALNGLVSSIGVAITAVADFVGWIGPKLQEALSQAIMFTRGVALFLTNELTSAFKSAGGAALDFMKTLGSMALDALVKVWQALPDWLTGTLTDAWNGMKSTATSVMESIKSAWDGLISKLMAGWKEWIDYYKQNQPQTPTTPDQPSKPEFKPNTTPTHWADLGQPQAGRPTTNPLGYDPKTGMFSGAGGGHGGGGYYRPPVSGIASGTMDWGFGMGVNSGSNRGGGGGSFSDGGGSFSSQMLRAMAAAEMQRFEQSLEAQNTSGTSSNAQGGYSFNEIPMAQGGQTLPGSAISVPALNIPQPTVEALTKAIEKANTDETSRLTNEQESWSKLTQGDQAAGLDNGVFSPALAALEAQAAATALANNPQLQDQLAGLNNANNNLQPGGTITPTGGLTTDAGNDLGRALSELSGKVDEERTALQEGKDATTQASDAMRTLGGDVQQLDAGVQQVGQAMQGVDTALQAIPSSMDALGNQLDSVGGALDSVGSALDRVDNTCQALESSVQLQTLSNWENTFAEQQNTIATDALSGEVQADTAANYADAAAQSGGGGGDSSGNGGGGGGGGQTPDNSYFDVGGVVGSWGGRSGPGLPASAWANAPHFADGGLTGGGIPIIAHSNEAVVPLKGGAIPVAIGTGIAQGLAMVRETVINVGTLAHNDALAMMGVLNLINTQELALLGAFNNAWAAVQAQQHASSGGGGFSSSRSSSSSHSSGTLDPAYLAPGLMRGWWGTSNQGGYLPATSQNVMTLPGGHKTDFLGRPIISGGAADGLANTNTLPGMTENGVALTVHPNEAVVNLNGGGRIPVELSGGSSQSNGERGGHTFHINMTVHAKDAASFGRGPTQDQIRQQLRSELARAAAVIGPINSPFDDPTVRVNNRTPGGRLPNGTNSF